MNLPRALTDLLTTDYETILSALPELYVLRDLSALPDCMLRITASVIANLFCTYNELHHETQKVVIAYRPETWREAMEPLVPGAAPFLHEHPVYNHVTATGESAPIAISDFVTEEAWRKTSFARHLMIPLGIADTLIFQLKPSPAVMIFIAINSATWGFSLRDKALAHLLRSHFTAAYGNAVAFTNSQAQAVLARKGAENQSIGVIVIEAQGQILHASDSAVRLIRKYYQGDSWDTTLPASIREWLSLDGSRGLPPSVLEATSGDSRLAIRWTVQSNGSKMLLLEESPLPEGAAVPSVGLTRREAEVLHWIAEGKTNVEIGRILSISVRTVEKHVEVVYRKLGVENRMGAVLRVLSRDGHT